MLGIRAALLAALSLTAVSGQSLLELIKAEPKLSNFSTALGLAGLDSLLGNSGNKQYTVFAPSNEAIANDPVFGTYMTVDGWVNHLRANIQLMIVPNQALSDAEVFDGVATQLVSLNGTLVVSQPFAQVNLVKVAIGGSNNVATNGVLHIMEGVMKPYWREYKLWDVDEHEELEALSEIITRIDFDDPLNEFVPSGTSWIASRNRGYGNDSIALGFYPIVQELTDVDNVEFQNYTYMYNLIDLNFYEQDIPNGFQYLAEPRNADAHMWITKDQKGVLRFNDAELDRQAFADNG